MRRQQDQQFQALLRYGQRLYSRHRPISVVDTMSLFRWASASRLVKLGAKQGAQSDVPQNIIFMLFAGERPRWYY
jgi:hypothetical protein